MGDLTPIKLKVNEGYNWNYVGLTKPQVIGSSYNNEFFVPWTDYLWSNDGEYVSILTNGTKISLTKSIQSEYVMLTVRLYDSGGTLRATCQGRTQTKQAVMRDPDSHNFYYVGAYIGINKTDQDARIFIFQVTIAKPGYSGTNKTFLQSRQGWNNSNFSENVYNYVVNAIPIEDPYVSGGGHSTTGGGSGSYSGTSDTISLPSAPTLNLSLNHFLSAYVPTITQLNDLADYVWGNYDKTDSSKVLSKILANPQDAIVGLFMLPFTPSSSTAIEVTIGSYGTSVNMAPLTSQFKDVDCGSLTIDEYWGNYLDYNPYTRLTLFLPGVGEVQLDPDEVMGVAISVLYRVDCLTGNFVCFVSGDNKIFAQYQGNCALQVPVSAADYSRLNQAMLQAALGAVGAVAGVATAGGAVAAAMEGAEAVAGGASTALNIMNSKVNHSHSGTLSGSGFFMGSQKPYVIIHRARQSVPEDANEFYGYPSNIKATLGAQYGFTSVSSIILDGVPLTDPELDELRGILKGGIINS